ncbi:TPA: hypothetical protein N0F65_009299 [Lagenidium giganteum]|uniref:Uncharacterized protein n=1 Tax=Lagenidium giganteum TaxID=4803 RepID=A0AAV2YRP8_9STRA|nr:TPA: hypothetical protein N0F65_009299 [Lagenidium giganteum]
MRQLRGSVRAGSVGVAPEPGPPLSLLDDYEHHVVQGSRVRGLIRVNRQQHALEQLLPFSWVRLVSSIGGLILLLSDIPRTGLGSISIPELDGSAPDASTSLNYGPYDYPVVRLVPSSNASDAPADVPLWPYKYDTLSVPTRSLAAYLNVSSYPRCVLYDGECASNTLPAALVFAMLDELMTATAEHLVTASSSTPFVFLTTSNWIDRLYQRMSSYVGIVYHNVRLTYVHLFRATATATNAPLGICPPHIARRPSRKRPPGAPGDPFFCTPVVPWQTSNPWPHGHGAPLVPLWDHMEARMAQLRTTFPHLQFEMLVLSNQFGSTSMSKSWFWPALASAAFKTRGEEIVTLARGQRCVDNHCETQLIEDYRYERMYVEHNAPEVYVLTACLRAFAQVYVWVRVLCLWYGCFVARSSEAAYAHASAQTKASAALRLFFRVPVHVIVYGSWLPVVAYAVAHFVDCRLFHVRFYTLWATMNGASSFRLLPYMAAAAIQMRNAWMLAVALYGVVLFQRHVLGVRGGAASRSIGIIAMRGFVVGITSSLTVFAQIRQISFRDSNIVRFQPIPIITDARRRDVAAIFETPTEFGLRYEVLILSLAFTCVVIVACMAHAVLVAVKKLHGAVPGVGMLWAQSHYMPFSVGNVGPTIIMSIFWKHEGIHDVWRRTPRVWCFVRALNVVLLTDPLVLWLVYGFGFRVYVHQFVSPPDSRCDGDTAPLFLTVLSLAPLDAHRAYTHDCHTSITCIDVLSSHTLPWNVLVECG